jgi:hypothetical protein
MTTQEVAKTPESEAAVTSLPNGWSLVAFGAWSVSVAPDGLIHLPRHVTPGEVQSGDFTGAMLAAAEHGANIKADNEAAGANDDRSLLSRRAIVREGAPVGTSRMPVKAGPKGSIGRRGGQRRANQPPPRGSQGFPTVAPAPRQSRGR